MIHNVTLNQATESGLPHCGAGAGVPQHPGYPRWRKLLLLHAFHSLKPMSEEMEAYYEDRSEKWLESDKAQDFESWMEQAQALVEELEALAQNMSVNLKPARTLQGASNPVEIKLPLQVAQPLTKSIESSRVVGVTANRKH